MSLVTGDWSAGEGSTGRIRHLPAAQETYSMRATSVSSGFLDALERHFPLEILGIHDRSLSLLCGDEVLSIASSDAGNLPRGVLVHLPQRISWKGMPLSVGQRTRIDHRYLWVSRDVRVDIASCSVWESRRRLDTIAGSSVSVRAAVTSAAACLAGAPGLGSAATEIESLVRGFEPMTPSELRFYPIALRHLAAAMAALSNTDHSGLVRALKGLVGLGIGLTPSGDDVLVGFLGSLVLLSDRLSTLAWVRSVSKELASWSWGRTHPVSITSLRCAANGEISEAQERLLRAVVNGDGIASVAACDSLRLFGHSSGGEIALGTLLAVEAAARGSPSEKDP